jgi:hypothetical protein
MIVVVLWLRNSYTFDYDYYFGDKLGMTERPRPDRVSLSDPVSAQFWIFKFKLNNNDAITISKIRIVLIDITHHS